MNSPTISKKDIYKAVGYTTLLVVTSIPVSVLGIQLLNLVLGHIKV